MSQSGTILHLRDNRVYPINPENHIPVFFTGLIEKTGQEIYECDIVLWNKKLWIVRWSNLLVCYMITTPESYALGEGKCRGEKMCRFRQDYYEKVGNVFENMDLLKEIE